MVTADDPVTTVKVPRSLRRRISRDAALSGQSAAGFLGVAVAQWERAHRMESVRATYSAPEASSHDYLDEVSAWDTTSDDGADG